MKIAVDVTPILPGGEGGGAKQLVMELLKGLGRSQGTEQYLLLTSENNHALFAEFESFGMKRFCVSKVNKAPSLWERFLNKLKRKINFYGLSGMLKKEGISLLFCPMTSPTYCEAGIPTVSILYDLQHMFYPSFFTQNELAHRNNFYNKLKQKVDYIICISSFTRDTVIEKLGISSEKVTSIPICVHNRFNTFSREMIPRVLSKYNLDGIKYGLYPANLWPHKNHKMLLTALNMYLQKYPEQDLDLVFSGAIVGDNVKIFKDAVKQMAISDRVHFLGYLPEDELAAIWAGAQFLVFPSLFEGFGIPLLEAMFFEKPIICSDSTSLPEVGGDAAIYFDPRRPDEIVTAMESVLNDPELKNLLVLKGNARHAKFNFDEMIKNYISAFYRVAQVNSKKEYYDVEGVYDDGWSGQNLHISFGQAESIRLINLELLMPDWHPKQNSFIRVLLNGIKGRKFSLERGKAIQIQEELPKKEGTFQLEISCGFIPGNGDTRTLTLMVKDLLIVNKERLDNILYRHGD